jgi:recombinational DNA repair protein (RecF pathway)
MENGTKPCTDCGTPIPTIFFSERFKTGLCRNCWEKRCCEELGIPNGSISDIVEEVKKQTD